VAGGRDREGKENMALSPKPVGKTARTSFPLRRQPLVLVSPTPREAFSRFLQSKF